MWPNMQGVVPGAVQGPVQGWGAAGAAQALPNPAAQSVGKYRYGQSH